MYLLAVAILLASCGSFESTQIQFNLYAEAVEAGAVSVQVNQQTLTFNDSAQLLLESSQGEALEVHVTAQQDGVKCLANPNNFVVGDVQNVSVYCIADHELLAMDDETVSQRIANCLQAQRRSEPIAPFCAFVMWTTGHIDSAHDAVQEADRAEAIEVAMAEIISQVSATFEFDFDQWIPTIQILDQLWIYMMIRQVEYGNWNFDQFVRFFIELFEVLFGIGVLIGVIILMAYYVANLSLPEIASWLMDWLLEGADDSSTDEFEEREAMEHELCHNPYHCWQKYAKVPARH